jgi:hypothetical protein
LDELQAEHAPQKEGDPTGKSTVERGFPDTLTARVREVLDAASSAGAD